MPCTTTSLVYQLIFALSSTQLAAAAPNLWAVNIWEGPAPSPEDGPPISANAQRDPAYLPYQLVAIFGSYLVAILIVGLAIITIGRRRRAIQTSPQSLGMEMKVGLTGDSRPRGKLNLLNTPQSNKLFGPSPVSPTKFWQSPNVSLKHGWENITGKSSRKTSVAGVSIATIDESVVEDDRTRNEMELDRLYAAVAQHEAQKEHQGSGLQIEEADTNMYGHSPPELQYLRYGVSPPEHGPAEMVEPYPTRTSTTSPRRQNQSVSPPQRSVSGGSARRIKKTPPAPLSLNPTAHSSRSSLVSAKSRSIRHYPISPPMGSPGIAPDYGDPYGDAEPLTPRAYAPGPPPIPPTPNSAALTFADRESYRHRDVLASPQHPPDFVSPRATHFAPSIRSSRASNATSVASGAIGLPQSPRSFRAPQSARNGSFPRTITEQPSAESGLRSSHQHYQHQRGKSSFGGQSYASCESEIQPGFDFSLEPVPASAARSGRASPAVSTHTTASNGAQSTATRKTRKAAPPTLALNPASVNGSTVTLPLNSNGTPVNPHHPAAAAAASSSNAHLGSTGNLPLRNMRDLRSPTSRGPPSAIKATFLERPSKRGPAGGLLRAPGTAGLAVPATPYSPYMPQTPMTPMTPSRLITREERKRREKEEGRRVLTEEDVVQEESEMWE